MAITSYIRDDKAVDGRKHFDSRLDTGPMSFASNARFELILRMHFKQGPIGEDIIDSVDADGVTHFKHDSLKWDKGEFDGFKRAIKKVGEESWSDKCSLVPPERHAGAVYRDLDYPIMDGIIPVMCNLVCRLVIDLVASEGDAHVVVTAFKYADIPGRIPRSNSSRYMHSVDPEAADVTRPYPVLDHLKNTYQHTTVIHEIGHALGMPHIGVTVGQKVATTPGAAVCTIATQGRTLCYEGLTPAQTACRMGLGDRFCQSDANPWLDRVEKHTGVPRSEWTFHKGNRVPKWHVN